MDSRDYFSLALDRIDATIRTTCSDIAKREVNIDSGLALLHSLIISRNNIVSDLNAYAEKYLKDEQ